MRSAFLLFLVTFGCSTTATIVTTDGRRTEATLAGGDRDRLLLRTEYGVESTVRRDQVKDIDYPGNVHALVGGLTAGMMGIELAIFGAMCGSRAFPQSACTFQLSLFGAVGAAGLALFSWGLWTWLNATSMVRDSLDAPPLPAAKEPRPVEPPLPAPSFVPSL